MWRLLATIVEAGPFPVKMGIHPHIAGAMVAVSYIVLTATVVTIAVDGFRHRSYGMPLWGIVSILGLTFICAFPGPAVYPHLFQRLVNVRVLLWMWRGWFVLHSIIFLQYLRYAHTHPHFWPALGRWVVPFAVVFLVVVTYGEWSYIVFYQDVYINEVYPIVILVMSVNYAVALFSRIRLRGLSLWVAWGWLIGNVLLYGGVFLSGMSDQYPCHDGACAFACAEAAGPITPTCVMPFVCELGEACGLQFKTGYGYIVFLYDVTIATNIFYVIGLTRRREELRPDWDVKRTIARMSPRI
jgi:hypothetical protein